MFAGSFTHFITAGIETAESAGNVVNLLFSLCLIFNGYVISPLLSRRGILTLQSQSPRFPLCPPPVLDIHVPRVPLHLPGLRHALNRSSQHRRSLRPIRISTHRPALQLHLRAVRRPLHSHGGRLRPQPRRHHGLQLLQHGEDERLSEQDECGLYGRVEELWDSFRFYYL